MAFTRSHITETIMAPYHVYFDRVTCDGQTGSYAIPRGKIRAVQISDRFKPALPVATTAVSFTDYVIATNSNTIAFSGAVNSQVMNLLCIWEP